MTTTLATSRRCSRCGFGNLEVDLALIQINTHDTHFDAVAQTEITSGTLAGKAVMQGVEMVVITRQSRNVNQPFDVDVSQLDEQAKAGYRRNHARE